MKWFKASGWMWSPSINEVEVIKESSKQLTIKRQPTQWDPNPTPYRVAKQSEDGCYFERWIDAQAYLIAKCESRVNSARRQLGQASGALGNVKGWKNPESAS